MTFTYGKGVQATEEFIETEAVYHFDPGARILSLGNVGCNLDCDYCQNWTTSQTRFLSDEDVWSYSPEQIVSGAVKHGINVLSWTYNDPVVWHEFLLETARLAKEAGLVNLFKSAFFITPEAVEELLPVIDIFSISVKSNDPEYYRKFTKGRLAPVLQGAKQVHKAGKHLEISNLMITDISDTEESGRRTAAWVLENLGPDVPLHYVGFHPAYRLAHTRRTPFERLVRARDAAREMGVKNVYLGNVYDHNQNTSRCDKCGAVLVTRFGLIANPVGLTESATCKACGTKAAFKLNKKNRLPRPTVQELPSGTSVRHDFTWTPDINSIHVILNNCTDAPLCAYSQQDGAGVQQNTWRKITVQPAEKFRIIITRSSSADRQCRVAAPEGLRTGILELLDRAHFPVKGPQEPVVLAR